MLCILTGVRVECIMHVAGMFARTQEPGLPVLTQI